jgi:hypothetical protein
MKALDNAGYTGWAISSNPATKARMWKPRAPQQRMDRIFALI